MKNIMKNIVLIVVDTLRPDHLGCYGYDRPTSPHLDALAERGVVLDALWSASNFTAPAFTSLFTGLYPHEHGVFDFHTRARKSWIHDALGEAGVRTGGVVSFRFFDHLLADIWGELEVVTDGRSFDYAKDLPMAVSEGGVDWLKRHGSTGPFCLFLHYDGPHMPYRLPESHATTFDTVNVEEVDSDLVAAVYPQDLERLPEGLWGVNSSLFELLGKMEDGRRPVPPTTRTWLTDKYDNAVRYNDEAIGSFLQGLADLGLADDTIVVVSSDHGEAFFEHGSIGHGGLHVYEEIIRTVGIVVDPAGPDEAGTRCGAPLSHVDILPQILRRAGVGSGDGEPLPMESWSTGEPVVCESKAKIALRQGDLKFVRPFPNPALPRRDRWRIWLKMALRRELGQELFDLTADPGETRNLAGRRDLKRPLAEALDRHLRMMRTSADFSRTATGQDRQRIEEEMKRLGYM